MNSIQAFILTPVGAISAYLAIGVLILGAGWVIDQMLPSSHRKD